MRIALLSLVSVLLLSSVASAQCSSDTCSAQVARPRPNPWISQGGFYVHVGVGQAPPVYPGYSSVLVQSACAPTVNVRVRVFHGGFFRRMFN